MSTTKAPPAPAPRIEGLDLARGLAVCGMVVVNYEVAMNASGTGPAWLGALTGALQGRAAGLFVVLAGIGASLASARALRSGDEGLRKAVRRTLLKRSLFLFVLGTAFLTVWPGDILHFYGAYLAMGAALLFARTRTHVAAALLAVLGGAAFLTLGDWAARWNFADLSYRGLWTPGGFVRNLILDGWHPVFPWFALYVFGMIVGRGGLESRDRRVRLGAAGAVALAATFVASRLFAPKGVETPGWGALLATDSFPPTPAYVVAAASAALVVVVLCCECAERLKKRTLEPMAATGRLALTLYLGHVIVGLGILEALDLLRDRTLPFAVGAALVFSACAILFSVLWMRRFRRGPIEALMRRACG